MKRISLAIYRLAEAVLVYARITVIASDTITVNGQMEAKEWIDHLGQIIVKDNQ